jgi:hypothetical protein
MDQESGVYTPLLKEDAMKGRQTHGPIQGMEMRFHSLHAG